MIALTDFAYVVRGSAYPVDPELHGKPVLKVRYRTDDAKYGVVVEDTAEHRAQLDRLARETRLPIEYATLSAPESWVGADGH